MPLSMKCSQNFNSNIQTDLINEFFPERIGQMYKRLEFHMCRLTCFCMSLISCVFTQQKGHCSLLVVVLSGFGLESLQSPSPRFSLMMSRWCVSMCRRIVAEESLTCDVHSRAGEGKKCLILQTNSTEYEVCSADEGGGSGKNPEHVYAS